MKYSDWDIIDTLFQDNPDLLVKHHLDSFDSFFFKGIPNIIKYYNPIVVIGSQIEINNTIETKEIHIYLGGKKADNIYYGKPIICENDDEQHYMYPNEARLKNMTYACSIHYDIDVEVITKIKSTNGEELDNFTESFVLNNVYFGKIPIMLQSKMCILNGLSRESRYNLGECKNDPGGYFIIDGKEKVIVSQEKFGDNLLYLRKANKDDDEYSYFADVRTVSQDPSKPKRTLSVCLVKSNRVKDKTEDNSEDNSFEGFMTKNNIVVSVPNIRKPVPLFILMRALGIISDKEIIEMCLLDLEKEKDLIDFFIPSIYDAGTIFSQEDAIKYLKLLIKHKTNAGVYEILLDYFLPNIGSNNFKEKAYVLGYMVKRLIFVALKRELPTDRDSFRYKRIENTGMLLHELFQEYYRIHVRKIKTLIDLFVSNTENTFEDVIQLIRTNYNEIFHVKTVEKGILKGFKGNWGSLAYTQKEGIVQDLNRLSFLSSIAHLRKLNLNMDSSAKVVKPRLLHSSHYGIVCPVHTPDGGNVGFHKHLAIGAYITAGTSSDAFILYLKKAGMKELNVLSPMDIIQGQKIFLNGNWIGIHTSPLEFIELFKEHRRSGQICVFTNVYWDIQNREIYFATDAGRLCRPLYYVKNDKTVSKNIEFEDKKSWNQLVDNLVGNYENNSLEYDYQEADSNMRYSGSVVEYVDTLETEGLYIAMYENDITKDHTHLEIHPSLMLSVLGNMIIFPENNQLPRDLFSCGQSKQAVSLYHSNFLNRIDTLGVVLNYGQNPIVKSKYLDYVCRSEHPYGENVIVAIACYSGYNVEDALIFNQASVDRGMFRTTYYKLYEEYESTDDNESRFMNILDKNVTRTKPEYDYNNLNKDGIIREGTELNDKMVLVGKATEVEENTYIDQSLTTKKGQIGVVDKSFITDGELRIAKIRVREERIPSIGDKLCSRAGQKGTIGVILPEEDMPFTEDGIRPDVIMNPHAIPSRMTIGHLVECIIGKVCLMKGIQGNCTAFEQKESHIKQFGKMLTECGFHSSGNQVLISGFTGEQLESDIFFGPNYYLRLKHMVKDKINFRGKGPRTSLTRQTVQGRSNDGGLRIGEMERDGLIAHGMTNFIYDSLMTRGDLYSLAVCNHTGSIAVYNESENIMYSPFVDGPLKFDFLNDPEIDTRARHISRFGRSFSVIQIPYSMKLLLQELMTMNVAIKIITDKNVNHLLNEKNVKKISGFKSYESIYKELSSLSKSIGVEEKEENQNKKNDSDNEKLPKRTLAIIVPYFDNHLKIQNQDRQEHKSKFLSHMKNFISTTQEIAAKEKNIQLGIDIYIIEQNNQNMKCNRGALLNIGFALAKEKYNYNAYMFHDIDLLPNMNMSTIYIDSVLLINEYDFVHIASLPKYNMIQERHIGGVLVTKSEIFEKLNGYPNIFEGWGGEDEAFVQRIERHITENKLETTLSKMIFKIKLEENSFEDLEKIDSLEEKIKFVSLNNLKNKHTRDSLLLDESISKTNGLNVALTNEIVEETKEYYPTVYSYLVNLNPNYTSYIYITNQTRNEIDDNDNDNDIDDNDNDNDIVDNDNDNDIVDNDNNNDVDSISEFDNENKFDNNDDNIETVTNEPTTIYVDTETENTLIDNVKNTAKQITETLAEQLPTLVNSNNENTDTNEENDNVIDDNIDYDNESSNLKTVTTDLQINT